MACGNVCPTECGGPSPQGFYPMMGGACQFGNPMGQMGCANAPMGYQEYPMGCQMPMGGQDPMGTQGPGCGPPLGQFDLGGAGCGGSNIPCVAQGWDLPCQARQRKRRPPSSSVAARKIGVDQNFCTTLATPLATVVPDVGGDGPQNQDEIADHEKFDVFTLAFGTKPGSNKPAKMLVTLKTPKVLAARLNTSDVATQVGYMDLGLPEPSVRFEDSGRESVQSRKSKKSKKSKPSSKGKGGKSKKHKGKK